MANTRYVIYDPDKHILPNVIYINNQSNIKQKQSLQQYLSFLTKCQIISNTNDPVYIKKQKHKEGI